MSDESRSWYRMTRPLFNSGYEDDEFWAYGQDGFHEVLDSFIGSDVLIYDKSIAKEPIRVRAIVQQKTSDVFNSTMVRQILCNIGILKCGQYVEYDGSYWLVSSFPDNNRIYEKAVLWKCKHTLRFISPLSGGVVEYPVFSTNSTQYGTGEEARAQVTVGDDQHLIYLPYNEETILLDNNFRFLMDKNLKDPTAYRVTRVDPVSYAVGDDRYDDGLIQWAVIQTQFNEETDDRDKMVADYYKASDGSEEKNPAEDGFTLVLTDLDGDYRLAIGEEKRITVSAFDANGKEIEDFAYRMEYDFADGAASVASHDGNTIVIRATEDQSFIGKSIVIHAVNDTLGCWADLLVRIVGW